MIDNYDSTEPLHIYIQNHFRKNKQFGSKDRRFYKDCCYGYFRFRSAFKTLSIEETIIVSLASLGLYKSELESYVISNSKLNNIVCQFDSIQLVTKYINCGIEPDAKELSEWFIHPAPVFTIANPDKTPKISNILKQSNVDFLKTDYGFQFPQNANLTGLLEKNLLRIMDLGSQLSVSNLPIKPSHKVWDCCAGAGGKSLFIAQFYSDIVMYCSDVRPTVLKNLIERFIGSTLSQPLNCVYNLELPEGSPQFAGPAITENFFDVIICDVPCSGSGTWRRNPEGYLYFQPAMIEEFAQRQRTIAKNAWRYLKPGGMLVYITCSVFTAENTDNAMWIESTLNGKIIEMQTIGGPKVEADYLFRAIIQKNK